MRVCGEGVSRGREASPREKFRGRGVSLESTLIYQGSPRPLESRPMAGFAQARQGEVLGASGVRTLIFTAVGTVTTLISWKRLGC